MTDEQKCLEWLKHRRDNTPMAGAKKMFTIAISALEKQEQSCDTCKNDGLPFCHLCSAQHKNFYERKEEGK